MVLGLGVLGLGYIFPILLAYKATLSFTIIEKYTCNVSNQDKIISKWKLMEK